MWRTEFAVTLQFGQEHLSRGRVVDNGAAESSLQGSTIAYVQEAMGWLSDADRLKDAIAPVAATDVAVGEPRKTTTGNSAVRKPVILVADDNADIREYLSSLLAGRFQLFQAGDGKAALAKAQQLIPGPGPDGHHDARRWTASKACSQHYARTPPLGTSQSSCCRRVPGEEARIDGIDAGGRRLSDQTIQRQGTVGP